VRTLGPSSRKSTTSAAIVPSSASRDTAPLPNVSAGLARLLPRVCSFGAFRVTQACK
jgi:hypothetical protein